MSDEVLIPSRRLLRRRPFAATRRIEGHSIVVPKMNVRGLFRTFILSDLLLSHLLAKAEKLGLLTRISFTLEKATPSVEVKSDFRNHYQLTHDTTNEKDSLLWGDIKAAAATYNAYSQSHTQQAKLLVRKEEEYWLNRMGIPCVSVDSIESSTETVHPSLASLQIAVDLGAIFDAIVNIVLLLSLMFGGFILILHALAFGIRVAPWVIARVPAGLLVAGVAVVGFLLYAIRCRLRLFYGIGEVLFGMALASQSLAADVVDYAHVIASLYVVVRGLDNVGKWIKSNGSWDATWSQWFGQNYS